MSWNHSAIIVLCNVIVFFRISGLGIEGDSDWLDYVTGAV